MCIRDRAYNGEKINKEEGKLLATNKIFDDCSGKTSITNALRDFQRYLSPHIRTEKPVVHISLNPHPDDVLTDMEMENIAREYLECMGYGNQPYMVYKHEDIDRHHMHIVTIRVDENGKCLDSRYNYHRSKAITRDLEEKYNLHKACLLYTSEGLPASRWSEHELVAVGCHAFPHRQVGDVNVQRLRCV